jgi:hypothetical protein
MITMIIIIIHAHIPARLKWRFINTLIIWIKRVTIKIPNKTEAEDIRHQAKEEIVARIQQCAGGKDASHTVLAVRQLKSGDLVVHMETNLAGYRTRRKDEELPAWRMGGAYETH